MAISEIDLASAEAEMATQRKGGYAVAARFDRRRSRVIVTLNTGVEITFPASRAEGLNGASPDALASIEISPAGTGLHWPLIDVDMSVAGLMQGQLGSRSWMNRLTTDALPEGGSRRRAGRFD